MYLFNITDGYAESEVKYLLRIWVVIDGWFSGVLGIKFGTLNKLLFNIDNIFIKFIFKKI